MMVNNQGYIIHKAGQKKGRMHDYIFKNIKRIILLLQKGLLVYLTMDIGVEWDFPQQLSTLPCKKKRTQKDLSQEEIEYNGIHSGKKRIVIENKICCRI